MAPADRSSFVEPLPARPNLEMQQKRAKDLARAVWAGDAAATQRVAALHPKPPSPDDLTLADAQLVVARGYGFDSWASMKRKIDSLTRTPIERLVGAVHRGDVDDASSLLEQHADVRAAVNAPVSHFDGRLVSAAKANLPMLDLLISYGADLNLKSAWWAGGFGILEYCTAADAPALIARGATVDIFGAANLGMQERVKELVEQDPSVVRARGGDGKTALHYAKAPDIARLLLDRGAEIDARDVDHESTAAQYLVREAPDAVRLLIDRGAWFDIFIAVALNDGALVDRCLQNDPDALEHRIGHGKYTVAHDGKHAATPAEIGDRRGEIYKWVLGFNLSAMDVAAQLGHTALIEKLSKAASPSQRLLAACSRGDRLEAQSIVSEHPGLVGSLKQTDKRLIADRAYSGDTEAVRLMLDLGFDPRVTGPEQATPLHWAAFLGNVEMTRVLLEQNPPIGAREPNYNGTPLGWCIYGSVHGWACRKGDFDQTARLLLEAGEVFDDASQLPTGCDAVDSVLRAHLKKRSTR